MSFLTHKIEGYDTPERVGQLTRQINARLQRDDIVEAGASARNLDTLHHDSRFASRFLLGIGTCTLVAACLMPTIHGKLGMTPLPAIFLLMARDQRRAQKAAATAMQQPGYKIAQGWNDYYIGRSTAKPA